MWTTRELLPVPLTTLRQPCHEIGVSAMRAMVDRVGQPDLPPREILLHGTLVVRESCGSSITGDQESRRVHRRSGDQEVRNRGSQPKLLIS